MRLKYSRLRSLCVSDRARFMYVIGSQGNGPSSLAVERYDVKTGEIFEMPKLPVTIYNLASACLFIKNDANHFLLIVKGEKMWSMNVKSEQPKYVECSVDLTLIA